MASRRFDRKPPSGLCAEPAADDGIDPRNLPKFPQGKVSNRKALQLCRQVARTLSACLEGDLLRDLTVESVVPSPDSSRLLVTFRYHGSATVATSQILAALQGERARLRAQVATGIHRRKTPELTFQVVR
jgi:ribosome-binding factor A